MKDTGRKGKEKFRLAEIRSAVADYMHSEGCTCCRDYDEHQRHEAMLGKLLRVPKYKDGSGYDFKRFRSAKP
jgi:methionine aminopeptidase